VGTLNVIAVVLAAYVLGCFVPGYYLVRWRTGQDLRMLGSGSLGAKNAGRILGRGGYLLTSLVDIAKGFAAVLLARWAGLSGWPMTIAALAVVAGHNWPLQLGFRGGKGVATGYGVLLAAAPWVAGAMWGVFLPITLLLRSTTLGGVAAFAAAPLLAMAFSAGPPVITLCALTAAVVAFTHRNNLQGELAGPPASAPSAGVVSDSESPNPDAQVKPLP